MNRKAHNSDLTDAEWAILAPFIPPPLPGGRPRKHGMREVLDAISGQLARLHEAVLDVRERCAGALVDEQVIPHGLVSKQRSDHFPGGG
jgi:transposase